MHVWYCSVEAFHNISSFFSIIQWKKRHNDTIEECIIIFKEYNVQNECVIWLQTLFKSLTSLKKVSISYGLKKNQNDFRFSEHKISSWLVGIDPNRK